MGRTPTLEEVCEMNGDADSLICNTLFTLSLNSLAGGWVARSARFYNTPENDLKMDVHSCSSSRAGVTRDYRILVQRYGLDGNGERTLEELAQANEVTRARIHQVEQNMLKRLRQTVN